ncbi:MAG: ABC transporter substrate-binding protein [Aquincola sp.]|nr:ABC transporter substrate-binding protein [Aquincola sp.]MDH4288088.1 ABC transporter substrate-binding protein [Aquincola sp.]MDH5331227.1 ABC transporter substrate-binding protein [Aquincola sp.]
MGNTAWAQPAAAVLSGDDAARLLLGQRIYREGIGASGAPLKAVGAAQTALSGKDAACSICHRRSGYGTAEGKFVIRPIIGPALLAEQTVPVHTPRVKARVGVSQRPAYTEPLLARAVRAGLDASGKPLDPVMPRYALNDEEMRALSAYLFSLSAQPSPGVDEEEMHFATVIQPGVAPERRRAMIDVMQAFVRDKGANVRSDDRRREAGNMRMYRSYRKWVLHEWVLSGPSETWDAQLEAYYRKQPVFALVGGIGSANWAPIHAFCERLEVPSVFAQADVPVVSGTNNYNFYLSRGVALEAEVLARYLRDQPGSGKIVQVFRRDDAGSTAAATLRKALATPAAPTLEDRTLDGQADDAFWSTVVAGNPAAVVLWLGAADLKQAARPLARASGIPLYLSFELLDGKLPDAALTAGGNARWVYPSDLPPRREARLLRSKVWFHNKGIAITDEAVQINALFAMTVVSDVVGHIMDSFSRDYFVERLEHVVGQTPMPSLYPQVSLGPGQRFAAKGSTIVQLPDTDKQLPKALSPWIVP